jgi:plastocyanin
MRLARLLPLPALPLLLALAAPASAATTTVGVHDDYFGTDPNGTFVAVQINPGDTVHWQWGGTSDPHTVTSTPSNLTTRFRTGEHDGNFSFSKTFNRRGRFTFRCEVHPDTMRGAVQVGPPPFPDSTFPLLRRLRAHPRTHRVKFTFRLSERSRVRVTLNGAKHKSVRRTRGRGRDSITIRHLPSGHYRARVRATDLSGNKGRLLRKSFNVP